MAINANFPTISFEGANPVLAGMNVSKDLLAKALANRIAGVNAQFAAPEKEEELNKARLLNQIYGIQAKYEEPMTQQKLEGLKLGNLHQGLVNQFYAPDMQSQIASRGIHDQLARLQGEKLKYELSHPEQLNPFVKQQLASYASDIAKANEDASNTLKSDAFLNQFQDAYKSSEYKGPSKLGFGGAIPTSGWQAALRPGHDFSPEIMADNAAQNFQASLIPLIKGGKLTNMELQFLGTLKPNRSMTPHAVEQLSNIVRAANERTREYARFLKASATRGVDKDTADALFNMYKEQRPIIDIENRGINQDYANTSLDYLNKDAVNAVMRGEIWEPPVTEGEIQHAMKRKKMTRDQVIKKLKEQGKKIKEEGGF